VIFLRFGLAGAVTRFYFDHREGEALHRYTSTVTAFLALWSCGVGLLLSFFGGPLFAVALPGVPFAFVLLGLWTAVLGIFPELQRRLLQAQEHSRGHLKLTLLQFGVGLGLTLFFVVGREMGVLGILLAQFLATVVVFGVAVVYLARRWSFDFQRGMLADSLRYGLPMLPHHLFTWLMSYVNRLILNSLATTAAVGVYGIALRFSSPLTLAFTALNTAWVPVYYARRQQAAEAEDGEDEDSEEKAAAEISRTVTQLFLLMVWATLGVAVAAPDLIRLLIPAEYREAEGLVVVLALGIFLRGLYFLVVAAIFYAKVTWLVPVATAVGAAVNIAGNYWLIPRMGAMGSAWAMVATNGVLLGIVAVLSHRLYAVRYAWGTFAAALALGGVLYLVADAAWALGTVPRLVAHGGLLLLFPAVFWFARVRDREEILRFLGGRS
jgi:O-antigen/teichoic acid export membrane protein